MKATKPKTRFKITPFENRGGSISYRVTGIKRNGERIRENFLDEHDAQCRHTALTAEYLQGESTTALRATKLSEDQLSAAETCFHLISDWRDLLKAVRYWLEHGKQSDVAESPTADEAFEDFKKWLDGAADSSGNGICKLRPLSRQSFKNRIEPFINSLGLVRVADVSPEMIEKYIGRLKVSQVTKGNLKRGISRFFTWCMARPRCWRKDNPARVVVVEQDERGEPEILTVDQCDKLLCAAEPAGLAPYISVCLFGGLRPFEARRLTWDKVNLTDKEIRVTGDTCKTGKGRVLTMDTTLHAWLKAYESKPFFPARFQQLIIKIKKDAGITKWPYDVMRHTAISHFFRKSNSYGLAAERFGNSETIIKQHYQGRVSSADTEKFYALKPTTNA
jgi:integrase